jgi:SAM-dependent methyltransferase
MAKFAELTKDHLQRLRALRESTGARDVYDTAQHYPLYAEEYVLARFVLIADLLRSTLDVPGNVAEFGSFRGANVVHMAKLLRVFDGQSPKRVHCFESFAGLTAFDAVDGQAEEHFAGTYRGSRAELEAVIEAFDLGREIVIHEGDLLETLPRFLAESAGHRFSFVYLDVDLHRTTAAALAQLHDRLNPGGLFVLDEYGWDEVPGETLAVHEFLEVHGDEYDVEYLRTARQPNLALRKRVSR